MASTEGTITVKLHLDTTEFFAELARVQEAILELEALGKAGPAEAAANEVLEKLRQGGSVSPRITHRVL
jgi:hypothetical protein